METVVALDFNAKQSNDPINQPNKAKVVSIGFNLWLDVHYEAGMLPFCFIVTFHLAHIKSLLSLILNTKRQIIAITVLGIVTVTFFYFMIEPAITASYNFFMASCFLLAYFRQIQTNSTKHYCKI